MNPNYRILPYNTNYVQHPRPQEHKQQRNDYDLREVNADELPPGEYEILAMFDGDEGVPKPVGPIDRKDAAKSIAHHQQVEYVRPPGSIFESYNRKPAQQLTSHASSKRSSPHFQLQQHPHPPQQHQQHLQSTSYASQHIEHSNSHLYSEPLESNEDRSDHYEPTLPNNQVRSLPPREPVPQFENKYRPAAPTPPPYISPTPQPYAPTPLPYSPTPLPYSPTPKHYSPTPKTYSPTPKPYASPTPQPYTPTPPPYIAPTPPPYAQVTNATPRPEATEKFNHFPTVAPYGYTPRSEDHAFRKQQQLQHEVEQLHFPPQSDRHLPPVKKEAQPFRFPDQNYSPVQVTRRPGPEPDFIYEEEQALEPTPLPVKRKIASQPEENRSEELVSTNDGRRKVVPRVIESNKARNPLEALKEIAGDAAHDPVSSAGKPRPKETGPAFVCPHDGHFGDPKDCTKFYRCAHGTALPDYCPGDLFWNTASEQCDWPEQTTCQFDPNSPDIQNVDSPTFVYLTFDDGPNEATDAVLNALAAEGIRATFFINSANLYDPKRENAERNARSLLRLVDDGHVLGDHSFNHMAHNGIDNPVNAYMNVDRDLKYFGASNINPVLDLLYGNDRRDEGLLNFVNTTMMGLVRMPYSNNWRVPEKKIHADCGTCTVPAASGQRGIEIANRLSAEGRYVIGWDLEWAMDFKANRNQYGGSVAYMKLRTRHTKLPHKIVFLCHDIAFRTGGGRDEEKELITFLQLAKKSGYTFRTMDTYVTDNVNV